MRRERLRRHWMDRPPLPTSPVPCDDVHLDFGDWKLTYSAMKPGSEKRMRKYDSLSRRRRDQLKLVQDFDA